jgi:hypothetical protein
MPNVDRSYDKQPWREMNAHFFRQTGTLIKDQTLVQGGKVCGSILDFAGEDTLQTYSALKPLLKRNTDLLLCENDPITYVRSMRNLRSKFSASYPNQPILVPMDAYLFTREVNHGDRCKAKPRIKTIGAFSLDLLNEVSTKWWDRVGADFFISSVQPAIKEYGVCALILNHTLDGHDTSELRLQRLESHVESFLKVLNSYCGTSTPRSYILPPQEEIRTLLETPGFGKSRQGAWLGRVHIYRSKTWRMATIRVYIQAKKFIVCGNKELS